jgi:hypothetical protein
MSATAANKKKKQIGIQTAPPYSSTKMTASQVKPANGGAEDRGKEIRNSNLKKGFPTTPEAASKVKEPCRQSQATRRHSLVATTVNRQSSISTFAKAKPTSQATPSPRRDPLGRYSPSSAGPSGIAECSPRVCACGVSACLARHDSTG